MLLVALEGLIPTRLCGTGFQQLGAVRAGIGDPAHPNEAAGVGCRAARDARDQPVAAREAAQQH
jgi:hypothetical protein